MTSERTEEDAVRGVLHLTVGGKPLDLRVLTFDETDAWLAHAGGVVSGLSISEDTDASQLLGAAMRAGSEAALASLVAYDVDERLGADLRKRINPVELRDALEVVAAAALPFDVEAARLVAAAYGGPTRLTAAMLGLAMTRLGAQPLARSTPSPSHTGASGTTRSTGRGRRSSSSSDGSTGTSSSATRHGTNGMPSPTA